MGNYCYPRCRWNRRTAGADGQDGANGNDGLDGNQGDDGFSTLIEITEESSGLNCVNGGVKVEAGLDSNRDNLLDSDEKITVNIFVMVFPPILQC